MRAFGVSSRKCSLQSDTICVLQETLPDSDNLQSQELQNDNQRLIDHTQKVADQAAARSEARLQDRVNENQKMRRRLEDQLRETNDKIEHTKVIWL